MSRKALRLIPLLVIVALVVAMLPTAAPAAQAQDKTKIVWFVGLGTGGQPEQLEVEYAVVDAFNASQDAIELEIIIADNNVAPDTLSTLIASGEAPDIIGPVGTTGANRFGDQWLDLGPLVEAAGYDLGQFPEASVDNFRVGDALVGLPFATFPSFMWYRPALFEEAGLEMPPMAYGEAYMLDGEEVPWNWDTIREVGMLLTVDANGYDATEAEFDADNTI
jgi:multiple sugar transport system substrate-binding protein